jgi:hypothetical protein
LADGAQLERDADTLALLSRERAGESTTDAVLIVAKQHDRILGPVPLPFKQARCHFENP